MAQLVAEVQRCRRCSLWKTRTNVVVGEGSLNAEVMFVGEAPGLHEDRQGRPFVGAAGKLLTELIETILGLQRADVYIANVLKCRPPGNRDPRPEEIRACTPFLDRQIQIIQPRIIVTLGRFSSIYLLEKAGVKVSSISRVRGKLFTNLKLLGLTLSILPTYHPAAALYKPPLRGALEADFRAVRQYLSGGLARFV